MTDLSTRELNQRRHKDAAMRLAQKIAAENGGVLDLEPSPYGIVLCLEHEGWPCKVAVIAYPRPEDEDSP